MTDDQYRGKVEKWFKMQRVALGIEKPDPAHDIVGVMLKPTDVERWNAWKAYFRAQDCKSELRGMDLCERDQWPSREPKTNACWRMFPSDWPQEFDPKGAADARA